MFMQPLRSVLILEDESLISINMEDLLKELGAERVLSFTDHAQAASHAETEELDCAILDVIIGGRRSFAVADILEARGIPFVFSSGLSVAEIEDRHRHRPFISKPFSGEDLRDGILRALQTQRPDANAGPLEALEQSAG